MELVAMLCMSVFAASGRTPTKKDLRQACLRWVAKQQVSARFGRNVTKIFEFKDGQLVYRARAQAEFEKELDKLQKMDANRSWNWTQIFKRVGAAHLPADKGGQPSHKHNRRKR
jgi:hypothetical protein